MVSLNETRPATTVASPQGLMAHAGLRQRRLGPMSHEANLAYVITGGEGDYLNRMPPPQPPPLAPPALMMSLVSSNLLSQDLMIPLLLFLR
jgi:hypothetical protein